MHTFTKHKRLCQIKPVHDEQNLGLMCALQHHHHISHLLTVNAAEVRQEQDRLGHLSSFVVFSHLQILYLTFCYGVTIVPTKTPLFAWAGSMETLHPEPTLCFLSILVERCQWRDQPQKYKGLWLFWSVLESTPLKVDKASESPKQLR